MSKQNKETIKAWALLNKYTKTIENLDLIYWMKKDVLERRQKMKFPKDWRIKQIKIQILNPKK